MPILLASLLLACQACSLPGRPDPVLPPTEPPPPTVDPALFLPPARPMLYTCYTCGGSEVWVLDGSNVRRQALPISMGQFYGYSPTTDRILYAREFAGHGAGPGNVSVSDLAIYDVAENVVTVLFEDNVVEALWAPNGVDLAYILATPTGYELHGRGGDGADRLLVRNVSFTWSFSPGGERIAFTRESGYRSAGTPGLYVVDLDTLTEIRISEVDKSGSGGIADAPLWSLDGRFVLLSHWGGPDEPRLVLARADGGGEVRLSLDPSLGGEWWYTPVIPRLLWFPDGAHLLGVPEASQESPDGPYALVRFRLDADAGLLRDGEVMGEVGGLIGWEVLGRSVWVMTQHGVPTVLELP